MILYNSNNSKVGKPKQTSKVSSGVIALFILIPTILFVSAAYDKMHKVQKLQKKVTQYKTALSAHRLDTINNLTATMYHPVANQCQGNPLQLADGTYVKAERASSYDYIAVSRDLLEHNGGRLSIGDIVRVFGAGHKNGVYQVKDKKDWDSVQGKITRSIDFLETPGTSEYKYNNVVLEIIIER